MRWQSIALLLFLSSFLMACPSGKYGELPDAPAADKAQAEAMWTKYLKALGDKKLEKKPQVLALFFSSKLMAHTSEKDFQKDLVAARRKISAGLFDSASVKALKTATGGPLLVLDSKAGEEGVPLLLEGDRFRFNDLGAGMGEWSKEAKHFDKPMPEKPSLLFLKRQLADAGLAQGERLRAAVALSDAAYRKVIISSQRSIEDPVVKLGLGLARVRIDGYDKYFLTGFPTHAKGLEAVAKADPKIFEEMLVKLTNQASMVEDPPANEILFKVAAGAPPAMQARLAKSLYELGEANPGRFANAVFNVVKDIESDPVLGLWAQEVARRGRKSPKVQAFLRKFSRQGEGAERKLCKRILQRMRKGK